MAHRRSGTHTHRARHLGVARARRAPSEVHARVPRRGRRRPGAATPLPRRGRVLSTRGGGITPIPPTHWTTTDATGTRHPDPPTHTGRRPGDRGDVRPLQRRVAVHARFLAPLPTIPAEHLARILTPCTGNKAWVGVAKDDPEDGRRARELGTTRERRRASRSSSRIPGNAEGIGSRFLKMLAQQAWSAGVCRLTASVLTESRHVLGMLRAVLGPTSTRLDGLCEPRDDRPLR